jgi:hypothetical protein
VRPLKLLLLIFCDGDKFILLRFFWYYHNINIVKKVLICLYNFIFLKKLKIYFFNIYIYIYFCRNYFEFEVVKKRRKDCYSERGREREIAFIGARAHRVWGGFCRHPISCFHCPSGSICPFYLAINCLRLLRF